MEKFLMSSGSVFLGEIVRGYRKAFSDDNFCTAQDGMPFRIFA